MSALCDNTYKINSDFESSSTVVDHQVNVLDFNALVLEGSPLAQVTDPGYKSKTAVVANIFYEYMDLGTHAFNENTLETVIIENTEGFVMAKNVHNNIL